MEHPELVELTNTHYTTITDEQLAKGLQMSVEGKLLDLQINCKQIEEDKAQFELFGMPWRPIVDKISFAIRGLRSAETLFTAEEKLTAESSEAWKSNRDPLSRWRSESVARLTHLAKLTDNKSLFASLDKIGDADGHPDIIQDAYESTQLVDMHFPALAKYNLTEARVAEGKAIVDTCIEVYPQVALGESTVSPAKEIRDRAYWHLSNLERELKEVHIPLIHFDNYERRCEYGSHYMRKHRD
jgi:hypothetical protein